MGLLPIYVLCLPSVLVLSSVHCYEWAKQMKFLLVVNIGRLNDIQTALKLGFWNFDTLFIQVKYQNMGSISLIVWKLWAFRQRSNFGNFQHFFHHDFRLKWKFWILMVSSERSTSNLSEYIRSEIHKIFFYVYKLIWVIPS